MEISFLGKRLKSPIIVGSGPLCHNGEALVDLCNMGAGAAVTKTIRPDVCKNPPLHMRLCAPGTLINNEGWSDRALEAWCHNDIPYAKERGATIIASIGLTVEEVMFTAPLLEEAGADFLEVVSYNSKDMPELIRVVKALVDIPVIAKISPNSETWLEAAVKCAENGADAITGFDSMGPVAAIDIETGESVLNGNTGWLSGKSIKPFTIYRLMELYKRIDIPIIGLGGFNTGNDVIEAMMAGASVVGTVSALIEKGPEYIRIMLSDLEAWMKKKNIATYTDIIGRAAGGNNEASKKSGIKVSISEETCFSCGTCAASCCYGALYMDKRKLCYNEALCRQCGLCSDKCPNGSLKYTKN